MTSSKKEGGRRGERGGRERRDSGEGRGRGAGGRWVKTEEHGPMGLLPLISPTSFISIVSESISGSIH